MRSKAISLAAKIVDWYRGERGGWIFATKNLSHSLSN